MGGFLAGVDKLLRGGYTQGADLQHGRVPIDAKILTVAGLLLGGFYGVFMGLYALMRGGPWASLQVLVTMAKVPLLFLLTLCVTFPSLYVFSALAQSRLTFLNTLRLLLAALTVNLALLASFGPVTGFFTLSTESYPFMVLLNVVFFAMAGFVGLSFLRKALAAVFAGPPPVETHPMVVDSPSGVHDPLPRTDPTMPPPRAVPMPPPLPVQPAGPPAARIFRMWTIIYAIVGAQMGWVLRPFIGAPDQPFALFRDRQSNFFTAVLEALGRLFS